MNSNQIEQKYQALLHRIDRKPLAQATNACPQSLLEKQDSRVKPGHDQALKNLYESSVSFKNDLADLRSRIKGISKESEDFIGKVAGLEGEMKEMGRERQGVERERERLTKEMEKRDLEGK